MAQDSTENFAIYHIDVNLIPKSRLNRKKNGSRFLCMTFRQK